MTTASESSRRREALSDSHHGDVLVAGAAPSAAESQACGRTGEAKNGVRNGCSDKASSWRRAPTIVHTSISSIVAPTRNDSMDIPSQLPVLARRRGRPRTLYLGDERSQCEIAGRVGAEASTIARRVIVRGAPTFQRKYTVRIICHEIIHWPPKPFT
jgi:hypothetical protein